jgi:hypothetical protein
LRELRSAWDRADGEHSHVNRFIDMHDLGDALVRAGFAAPVLDVERYTLQYESVRALAADLKALGARNFTAGRRRTLTGRSRFAAMTSAYEPFRPTRSCSRRPGRLPRPGRATATPNAGAARHGLRSPTSSGNCVSGAAHDGRSGRTGASVRDRHGYRCR